MGNTADKADSGYACDTLAREITFKQYRSGSEQTSGGSSDESNSYNNKDSRKKPLTHQSSIRRRKDLRASYRKSKHGGGEKGAAPFKLSDMEVECVDGKVCRLVPRDSAKQRLRKKVSRSSSKSVKKAGVKTRPAIKPDSFVQQPVKQPKSKPYLPPKTKEKHSQLTTDNIWQLDAKPDILKCEQQKPDLPPKRKTNNVTSQPITGHRTKHTESVNLNNNKMDSHHTEFTGNGGLWYADKKLHTSHELSYAARNSNGLNVPDVTRCADLSQRLNRMKLVSPISDV